MVIFKKILFTFTIFIVFQFSHVGTYAAQFIFNPASSTYTQTCNQSIDIRIDTQGQSTNAADILVYFNPAEVEIIDSDSSVAGLQIKQGNVYQSYFGNQVDSTLGEIRLTGASFSTSFVGVGTFATIEFKSKPGITASGFNIDFTGVGPYVSLDSNIADTLTSNDLLSGVTNGYYLFNTGSCVADVQPPAISFVSPTNGQSGVPSTASISLNITDALSGVDIQTVEVVLNGNLQTYLAPGFTYSGTPNNYSFTISPSSPIVTSASNILLVRARDFAGNATNRTIVFNTPVIVPPPVVTDNTSPVITFINPVDKGTLPLSDNLTFTVEDTDSGIDINTLNVILNGVTIPVSNVQITYVGTEAKYTVTLNPSENLPDATSYFVVSVSDKAGNGLVKSIAFNIKSGTTVVLPPEECIIVNNTTVIQGTEPIIVALQPIFGKAKETQLQWASIWGQIGAILGSILLFGAELWQLPYLLFQWLNGILAWLGLKKAGKPYGFVYDSINKEPLSLAIVRIFDTTGKLVYTDVTDAYGVFNASINKGTYYITVTRQEYSFPSSIVIGKSDNPIENVYHGERFTVEGEQEMVIAIPLDPLKLNMIKSNIERVKSIFSSFAKLLTPLLMLAGFLISIYLLVRYPSIFNIIITILYIPTFYFYLNSLKQNNIKYGVIKTLQGAITQNLEIGLYDADYDKLEAKRITDENGYYRFVVQPGKYKVRSLNPRFSLLNENKLFQVSKGSDLNQPMIIAEDLVVDVKQF